MRYQVVQANEGKVQGPPGGRKPPSSVAGGTGRGPYHRGGPVRAIHPEGRASQPPLPPMREGAPARRAGGKLASLPVWASEGAKRQALEEYHADVLAATTSESHAAKLRTVYRAFARWGCTPFPPSLDKVHALGASLKKGLYRTAASYLSL